MLDLGDLNFYWQISNNLLLRLWGMKKVGAALLILLVLSADLTTILLKCLSGLRLGDNILQWFCDAWTERFRIWFQRLLLQWVPTRFHLAPCAGWCYLDLLPHFPWSADNTQLYLELVVNSREAVETVIQWLKAISEWMYANELKLNLDEMKVLLVRVNLTRDWRWHPFCPRWFGINGRDLLRDLLLSYNSTRPLVVDFQGCRAMVLAL